MEQIYQKTDSNVGLFLCKKVITNVKATNHTQCVRLTAFLIGCAFTTLLAPKVPLPLSRGSQHTIIFQNFPYVKGKYPEWVDRVVRLFYSIDYNQIVIIVRLPLCRRNRHFPLQGANKDD